MLVVLLLLDVCSRFEIASPTGYKKGTQKNYFYNRPFFGPLLNEYIWQIFVSTEIDFCKTLFFS